ncbi:hypothetical protein MNBD_GAMMA04-1698, partial [hydrothermal vent metagenome]
SDEEEVLEVLRTLIALHFTSESS